jgi:AcrR family transcriptional regulator
MTPVATATDSRQRILDAACELIASGGIDELRIARVATRAGASTALVHHYFSTREELLELALAQSFELAGDERFGRYASESTATAGLARTIAECLPLPGEFERQWVLWVELWLRAVRDPALRPIAARLYGRYRDWIAAAIRAGTETGEFNPVDVDLVADHVMALLDGFGLRALIRDPEMEVQRARRLIAELLGRELGVPADDLAPPLDRLLPQAPTRGSLNRGSANSRRNP